VCPSPLPRAHDGGGSSLERCDGGGKCTGIGTPSPAVSCSTLVLLAAAVALTILVGPLKTAHNVAMAIPLRLLCGSERWSVKTSADDDRRQVNLTTRYRTIAQLNALTRPKPLPKNGRVAAELRSIASRARSCSQRTRTMATSTWGFETRTVRQSRNPRPLECSRRTFWRRNSVTVARIESTKTHFSSVFPRQPADHPQALFAPARRPGDRGG
jgi:hypothetical protein